MDVLLWFSMCLIFYQMSAVESVREQLLFANTHYIMEVDVDTQTVTKLLRLEGGSYAYSLDYDYVNRYVYFPRQNLKDIVRFQYPSQSITLQHVVNTAHFPVGVAVDSANDHVYWVDDGNRVSRCKSDGTNLVVLTITITPAFMIRLDVSNRWMYIGYVSTGISKSRFDLTEISMIANFTPSNYIRVVSMDIDLAEQRLYWMNYDGDIKSVNVDGSDVKTVISTNSPSSNYYALGVLGSYIFCLADYRQLVMMNKSQGSTPTVLYTGTSTIASIYVFDSTGT